MFDIGRREFITLLGGAAAWPVAAKAQQTGRVHRVGLVFTTSPVSEMAGPDPIHPLARSFVQALAARGYLHGQNLLLEHRSAEGKFERFREIMQELVSINVDVIVTVANPMTQAARECKLRKLHKNHHPVEATLGLQLLLLGFCSDSGCFREPRVLRDVDPSGQSSTSSNHGGAPRWG